MRRIGKGKSNLTLLLGDGAGRRWVLRRAPAGPLVASAHDIPREAGILEALAGTQVPSPCPLALTPAGTVSDAPVLLSEHVEGSAIDGAAVAEVLEPSVRGRIGPALAATLASIHAVDLDGTGLADLARHGE